MLTDSTLIHGGASGLYVGSSATLTFSNNQISDHADHPVTLPAANVSDLDSDSDLTGNGLDTVRIHSVSTDGHRGTWHNLSVPYLVDPENGDVLAIKGGSRITIEAGTELRFRADAGLKVVDNSDILIAQGTESEPIRFVGISPGAGTWRGIFFESGSTENVIDHAEITGAGSLAFNSNNNRGAVIVYADATATVSNTTISDTPNCGISAEYNSSNFIDGGNITYTNVPTDVCTP